MAVSYLDVRDFKIYLAPIGLPTPFYKNAEGVKKGEDYSFDNILADPVYTDGLNHKGLMGIEFFMPVALNGYQLPLEPVISISGKKTIIETPLTGNTRRGTVKEIITTDDYEVKIRGIIINETANDYPYTEVAKLRELFEKNEALTIVNALTNLFEIKNIVIKSLDLPEMVGVQNAQAYTLSCVSDEDFLLIQE